MKSAVLRGSLVLFLLVCVFILANQFDDDLTPEAKYLVQQLQEPEQLSSNAYIFHVGIFAPPHLEPENVGKEILKSTKYGTTNFSYAEVNYPSSDRLPIPRGKLFCSRFNDNNCIRTLFTHNEDIDAIKRDNKILLTRNTKFHSYKNYKTLTRPSKEEHIPQYAYLLKAERILVLDAIQQYRSNNIQKSIEMLYGQLDRLKTAFHHQDHLLGKMIFIAGMDEVLDVASVILAESGVKTKKLNQLTHDERNLDIVAAREFRMAYNAHKNLDRNPELLRLDTRIPEWLIRTIYKPNMSINAVTPIYSRLAKLSTLSLDEFAFELSSKPPQKLETSGVRNILGKLMLDSVQEMDKYVARIMDLNVKIQLFNHRYHEGLEFNSAENPYFSLVTSIESEQVAENVE